MLLCLALMHRGEAIKIRISCRAGGGSSLAFGLFSVAGQFASLIKVKIAMSTQAFLKLGSCPVQSDLYGVDADIEDFGNLTVCKTLDLAED